MFSAEIYDPDSNIWTILRSHPSTIWYGFGAVTLPWGQVVMPGGATHRASDIINIFTLGDETLSTNNAKLLNVTPYHGIALLPPSYDLWSEM